jgi:hypothetical protein
LYLNPKGATPRDTSSIFINNVAPSVPPDLPELIMVALPSISELTITNASPAELRLTVTGAGVLRAEDWKDAHLLLQYTISPSKNTETRS